jgi:hypothetical protein
VYNTDGCRAASSEVLQTSRSIETKQEIDVVAGDSERKAQRMKLVGSVGAVLLLLFTSSVCDAGFGAAVSRHNQEIDQPLREAIHKINNTLIESMRKNEPSVMLDLFIAEVRRQNEIESSTKKLYSRLSELLRDKEFELFNEYSITLKKVGTFNFTIPSETEDKFVMLLQGKSSEMYVSLLRSKGDFKEFLLSFIYMREKGEWRLQTFHAGVIGIAGKTALQWLEEAKALSKKGCHLPALLRLQVAASCIRPAPFIQDEKEKDMIALSNKLRAETDAKQTLPMRVPNVETGPQVYYIEPQFVQTDLLPLVKYVTTIPLDDASALQKEVEAMTAEMESAFPGITRGVSHILYKAFSEPPTDPAKDYLCYGLTVEIK